MAVQPPIVIDAAALARSRASLSAHRRAAMMSRGDRMQMIVHPAAMARFNPCASAAAPPPDQSDSTADADLYDRIYGATTPSTESAEEAALWARIYSEPAATGSGR